MIKSLPILLLVCLSILSGCASKKEDIKITDYQTSIQTLKLSCQQNFRESCRALGLIANSETDYRKAEDYFVKACDLKDAMACRDLANLKVEVSGNILASKAELFRACKLGLKDACQKLRVVSFFDKNISKLYENYQSGCQKNNADSCYQMGAGLYHYQDYSEAKKALEKGCDLNLDYSCHQLAHQEYQSHHFEKALHLYKKLCDKNFFDSCAQIERGKTEGVK